MPTNKYHSPQQETQEKSQHNRWIRDKELRQIVPLSRSHIATLEKQGKFPKRRKIGGNTVAWKLSEVLECMDHCKTSY